MGKFTEYRPFDGKAGNVYKLSEHVGVINHTARLIIDAFKQSGQAWSHTEHGKNIQVLKLYCDTNEIPYTVEHKRKESNNSYFLIKKVQTPDD